MESTRVGLVRFLAMTVVVSSIWAYALLLHVVADVCQHISQIIQPYEIST